MTNRNKKHFIDLMFIIALFMVFAASALLVVIIGAGAYKSIVNERADNFDNRTSLNYIARKVREFDYGAGAERGEVEGVEALVFTQHVNNNEYLTYIFYHEGKLKELTINGLIEPMISGAQTIMDLNGFSFVISEDGMITLFVVNGSNEITSMDIYRRCSG